MNHTARKSQIALELVGPDKLRLNRAKPVYEPGRHQILCRVEAVGLCFSDLKLLKQFSSHARKMEITSGIEPQVLKEIPSYVPGEAPTVPGHEAVVRICAAGKSVGAFKPGERYLVQTDYRWLLTANSNAAFGYNFEGALQEYVLMDQRVITSQDGETMLIPASEELSAAAIALVEPWACVEDAYASKQRQQIKAGGDMAVVADVEVPEGLFRKFLGRFGRPGKISWVSRFPLSGELNVKVEKVDSVANLADAGFDDVIYLGSAPEKLESLFSKVAPNGLLNIVLCGNCLGRDISCPVGRIHYGGIRLIGTTGRDPARAMEHIPESGEIRKGSKVNIIGAGGPMGVMHVVRNLSRAVKGLTVFAAELDEERLARLSAVAQPLAAKNKIYYHPYNPSKNKPRLRRAGAWSPKATEEFDYIVLMPPLPALVVEAVEQAAEGGIINIFAGIPTNVKAPIDLDTYLKKRAYFIGTSGSTLEDMKRVLEKVESRRLDTNLSVGAVCGLDGAVEGIRALEERRIPGKIIVYPKCKGLGLVPLQKMQDKLPQVARCLENGFWNVKAEKALLEMY